MQSRYIFLAAKAGSLVNVGPVLEQPAHGFRLIASGIDFASLPQLDLKDYPEGLYMPLGIAVASFTETYQELHEHPPAKSSYFALLLDQKNRWLDHRKIALDGLVMFRDQSDPHMIHFYLLSYERISLVSHIAFRYSQLVKE